MAKRVFSEILQDAKLMAEGIRNHQDELSKVGLDEAKAAELLTMSGNASDLDVEQEELKTKLKSKTAELEAVVDALEAELSAARKLIKAMLPQTAWKEFGVDAKR